jgi:hypothetical protein
MEETEMATQTVELPDGTKITTPMPVQAASPPPPPPAADAPPADAQGSVEERLAQCEAAIQAIIEQINKMMQESQVAAVEAAMGPAAVLPDAE